MDINAIWAEYGAPILGVAVSAGTLLAYGKLLKTNVKSLLSKFTTSNGAEGIASLVTSDLSNKVKQTAIKIAVEPLVKTEIDKIDKKHDSQHNEILLQNQKIEYKLNAIAKAIARSEIVDDNLRLELDSDFEPIEQAEEIKAVDLSIDLQEPKEEAKQQIDYTY